MSDPVMVFVERRARTRPYRAELPSLPMTVRLSPEERQRAITAAKVNRQNLSEFVRDAVVTAAEDCLEKDT